jgi:hypothetical protein
MQRHGDWEKGRLGDRAGGGIVLVLLLELVLDSTRVRGET